METKQKIVMVVEDEAMLLQAIVKKLTLNEFTVLPYSDGEKAVSDLISHTISPDIIWLDYYLGNMNGMEFVTQMREHSIDVPVVIVSNSANDTKVKTMLALGVKKYILKAHHRLEEIIIELQSLLKDLQ
jgi:DNA-binding response OmpR family regulator